MRVEITEDRLSDTDPDTDRHYLHERGDVITVPDALGAKWCMLGWARDVAGNVPTGERIPGVRDVVVDVQDHTIGGV
jgi:hypothetical protein